MYMTYHKDNHRFNNSYHNYQALCSISHTIQTRNLKFSLQKLRVFFENYCFHIHLQILLELSSHQLGN